MITGMRPSDRQREVSLEIPFSREREFTYSLETRRMRDPLPVPGVPANDTERLKAQVRDMVPILDTDRTSDSYLIKDSIRHISRTPHYAFCFPRRGNSSQIRLFDCREAEFLFLITLKSQGRCRGD